MIFFCKITKHYGIIIIYFNIQEKSSNGIELPKIEVIKADEEEDEETFNLSKASSILLTKPGKDISTDSVIRLVINNVELSSDLSNQFQ